jgi:glycosyltransferase involved in cell wall biosynthesis
MKSRLNIIKEQLIEFIKYDYNQSKAILVFLSVVFIKILQTARYHSKAFNIGSQVYRTGWKNSDKLGLKIAKYYFMDNPLLGQKIVEIALNNIEVFPNTKKFIEDPLLMLDGVINVLKRPGENEKGALIINYIFYFSLFLKSYDVKSILKKYNLILEPSWAGLCEINILAYTFFEEPIFLQVYEQRDKNFIISLNSNIIPIDVGPSWFIDHQLFCPLEESPLSKKPIDVIMVAAWAAFKRHRAFFKSIVPLIKIKPNLKIVLVGYPVDMTKDDVISAASQYGIEKNIEIHEWIKHAEVRDLLCKSKVNILWSKFEGNNRAIIEGMFCDVPCIMREGHNYGEKYDFINSSTGCFSTEKNLSKDIESLIGRIDDLSPREYVMNNRDCISATKIMSDVIRDKEKDLGNNWHKDLSIKLNGLHGMTYLLEEPITFYDCYEYLKTKLKNTSESIIVTENL